MLKFDAEPNDKNVKVLDKKTSPFTDEIYESFKKNNPEYKISDYLGYFQELQKCIDENSKKHDKLSKDYYNLRIKSCRLTGILQLALWVASKKLKINTTISGFSVVDNFKEISTMFPPHISTPEISEKSNEPTYEEIYEFLLKCKKNKYGKQKSKEKAIRKFTKTANTSL